MFKNSEYFEIESSSEKLLFCSRSQRNTRSLMPLFSIYINRVPNRSNVFFWQHLKLSHPLSPLTFTRVSSGVNWWTPRKYWKARFCFILIQWCLLSPHYLAVMKDWTETTITEMSKDRNPTDLIVLAIKMTRSH